MASALPTQEKLNLENYTLIWLDQAGNDSREIIQTQQYLRAAINYMKIFKYTDECTKYIRSLSEYDRVVMIVSGRLGQEIVPRIHQFRQVSAIYVYCMDKKKNESWAQPFKKIKQIMVNLDELIKKIRDDQIERQRNKVDESFPMYIFQSNSPTNQSQDSFIYTHILINCLIETHSALTDKDELLEICRKYYAGNELELKLIDEFEQNYFPSRALWWYTRPAFLSRILYKALQIQDMEMLLRCRFFIRDIERQLEKSKCTSLTRVYCGQIMSKEDLQFLKNNIRGCLIINSFLSTTGKQQVRTLFTQIELSDDYTRVLFEIEADPHLENIKPFSQIKSLSYYPNEEQTLFMLGSIFRLNDIRPEGDGMWTVRMALCSGNDPDIRSIYNQKQMQDPFSFGRAFSDMKRFDDAEIYYHHLLRDLPAEHVDIALGNDALGYLKKKTGDYDSSLQYFEKALEMRVKLLQPNHPDIGDGYANLGEIYQKKNDVKRAFDAFNKAIAIYSKTMNSDHPKIAGCINGMGDVHMSEQKYAKALECYEKALLIRKKCFADTHRQIGESFRNIGNAYMALKNPDQALDNYNRAIRIYEKSDSPPDFSLGLLLKIIGDIYEKKKDYQQAHQHYEKALKRFSNVVSPTDEHIVQIQKDIQQVKTKLK